MSVSWARLFPTGEEETPNPEGIQYYKNLFQECKKYNISYGDDAALCGTGTSGGYLWWMEEPEDD